MNRSGSQTFGAIANCFIFSLGATLRFATTGRAWCLLGSDSALAYHGHFHALFWPASGVPSDGIPYPLFSFCALVPWTYFSSTLSLAGNSLVSNSSLITKVYFPRVLLPAATVLSGLVDFLMGATFLALMMIYYRVKPGWSFFLVHFSLRHDPAGV